MTLGNTTRRDPRGGNDAPWKAWKTQNPWPASLRSDRDRHHIGITDRDQIGISDHLHRNQQVPHSAEFRAAEFHKMDNPALGRRQAREKAREEDATAARELEQQLHPENNDAQS